MAAPALNQDVQHVAVLADRAPEMLQSALHADEDLIEVPLVARSRPSPFQLVGEQPAEAQALLAGRLMADHGAAGGEDGLHIPQAEAEAATQLHCVLDDLRRVAEAAVCACISDDALAETTNGLYKAEAVRRCGPWRSVEAVAFARTGELAGVASAKA